MQIVFFIFFLLSILNSNFQTPNTYYPNTYYMATDGDDGTGDGSIGSPWKTIEFSTGEMVAGDTLYIRGGTHRSAKASGVVNRFYIQNLNGTITNKFNIFNYPGETVIFNMDDVSVPGTAGDGPVGLKIEDCKHIHIKGIRITEIYQNQTGINTPAGAILYNVDSSTIELLEIDNVEGYGMYLQNGSDDNLIKNCDIHHLADRYSTNAFEGANGFNITGGDASTRNVFDGCRAWWCSDDGFDFYGINGVQTIKNSWAFWNGYRPGSDSTGGDGMGFKLGPTATDQSGNLLRYLNNNLAFENRRFGFDQNAGETNTCQYQMYNNTAYDNGENNYFFGANTSIDQIFKNNLSYLGGINGDEILSGTNVSNNSWNGSTVTGADFVSLSSVGMDGARGSDGSLPVTNFLRLATGSDLIDAGVNVGLPFSGSAPCIGAFEYSEGSTNKGMPLFFF